MLSSAIIIFREVFEIVFILGIILAATRDLPHRAKAIALGFGGGIFGSFLLALFAGQLSEMAEGMGQEYFNAGILFTASAFIGWTVLWMKRHGREMKGKFQKLGQDVAEGGTPLLFLSLVIALTLLREGSEIVLFSYGMLASGQTLSALLTGGTIGLLGGALTGTLLYLGLIRLSTRYFFRVTGGLLMLLVAGMMTQGVGFLTAAGAFDSLAFPVWDSAWLIGEDSIAGQTLHALIGYTAQPSAIQLIVYALTIGTLVMLMNFSQIKGALAVFAVIGTVCVLIPSSAHATKTVYSPYVEEGELELEWKGGYTIDDDSDTDGAWKQKLAIGYGFTPFWFSEIYGEVEKEGESGADPDFTALEWENRFQITQPGEYFVDVGALAALERNTAGGADKGEVGLLLAKDTGAFSHTANVIAEREFGEESSDDTEVEFAWNSRYRFNPAFEPGVELYSGFGSLSDGSSFDEDSHQIGLVAQGKIGAVKYNAGYLFGLSDSAPDGQVKAILEYERHF